MIDCSLGNPLFPMRTVANYAFRQARKDLHCYQFMNAGHSDGSVRQALKAISDYMTARGIQPPGWSGLPYTDMMPVGGGTTEGFNLILQWLADDVEKENEWRKKNGVTLLKPAILMPVPTYGFFQTAARDLKFTILTVERDLKAGGVLHREDVIRVVRKALDDGLRIVSYFDSNPNNPTGLVRGEEETRSLGEVFTSLNHHYEQEDRGSPDETIAKQMAFKWDDDMLSIFSRRPRHHWDGPASRVRIIDDMVYDGLEYDGQKPFSFAQIDELYKDTFALFGVSKAGLANLRAGLVIGNSRDLDDLNHRRMMNEYFPSKTALHALEGYFNIREPFAAERKAHLDQMNEQHRFRGLFMKALVNGSENVAEITKQDFSRMVSVFTEETGLFKSDALKALRGGIPGLKIVTAPQAGFFHLIDFSELKGREYRNPLTHPIHNEMKTVENGKAIHHIFENGQNMHFAGGEWMGLENEQMIGRITFAMPVADIIEVSRRLKEGMKAFSEPQPKKIAVRAATPA